MRNRELAEGFVWGLPPHPRGLLRSPLAAVGAAIFVAGAAFLWLFGQVLEAMEATE